MKSLHTYKYGERNYEVHMMVITVNDSYNEWDVAVSIVAL